MPRVETTAALVTASLLLLAGCQSPTMSDGGGQVATEESTQSGNTEAGESVEPGGPATFSLELGEGLGIEGVSPELIAHPDGGYLLLVTGLGHNRAYRSEDGVSFTPDSGMRIPMGSDYSLLQKPDGTWLLYYVSFDMPQAQPGQPGQPSTPPDPKAIKKKVMVSQSSDLSSFPEGVPTGIAQDQPGPAWGVPDTYMAPDGTYRMMWVDRPADEQWEVLRTATSPDGITFTPDEGYAITDGYVDPFMLTAEEGEWVLLLSTTPSERRLPQKVFVATSSDGLSWTIEEDPLLADDNRNYLDPAAVEVAPGEWVVVISTADKANAISGPHEYVGARLLLR
jgi:hypothetical protein